MSTTSQTQDSVATLELMLNPIHDRMNATNGENIEGGVTGKMDKLDNTKEAIRQVISQKGVAVTADEPFAAYPEKIGQLPALPEEDDWQPNPTWWDIETILNEDTRDYAYKSILLYMDTYSSTNLWQGAAYATSDGHFYTDENFVSSNIIEHSWDTTKDKQCVEYGVNTYKTRYIIIYSKVPIKQFPSGWGYFGMLGGIMQQNTINPTETPFSEQRQLQFIKILEGPEKLLSYFADNCPNLRSITLPQSLKTLSGSMGLCPNLRSIILPDNLAVLPQSLFTDCYNLTKVKLPANLENLPSDTFNFCSSLKTIELPETLTTIGSQAFYGCTTLSNIVLPAATLKLGTSLFAACSGLQDITLPAALKEIPSRMFTGCTGLKRIAFPDTLETIGERAFERVLFTELILPASLKTIKSTAFIDCRALTKLEILCTSNTEEPTTTVTFGASPLTYVSVPEGMDWSINITGSDLSVDNLIAIFHALKDNTTGVKRKLMIGTNNSSKLTAEQKAIATNKNWILA